MSFLAEIKRRKVFQVAAVYVVVAWLLIQVADVVLPTFEAPTWVLKVVIFLTILGFPITLTMSWAFNFTPDGFVKDQGPNVTGRTSGRRIEYVLIGLMVIGLGWLVYRVEFDAPISADNPPMPAARVAEERSVAALEDVLPNSIAVLPFTNLSPDPDNAYFAAGIYQSTLNQLGQFSDLFVIASASVMQYANDPPPIPEIAKALNVEVVMTGSVRYADGRVLITAQLIEGRTGRQIWSKEYRRELTDVFAVQGEVAEQIAMAMQVQLIPEERARVEKRPTESEKAYQHYLYALSLSNWAVAPEIWDAYTQSLERAIVEDPDFAEAYALLSYTYAVRGDTDIAIRYANKAIELEPTVATAYRTLGDIDADYFARQDRSREALKRSVELSPNDAANLSYYAYRLSDDGGDFSEAIRLLKRSVAIDPTSADANFRLGYVLMLSGDLSSASTYLSKALSVEPNYANLLNMATFQYLDGNHASALDNLNRALQLMSSRAVFRVDYLAYLYGLLGEPAKAAELVAHFQEIFGDKERQAGRTLGWGILGTRDKDRALREWTDTVNAYIDDDQPVSPGRISRFRENWLNDPMLEEPEFLELRRRLGFKE
jgi:TolB-like protein/Flp pilus assembly protein TadD